MNRLSLLFLVFSPTTLISAIALSLADKPALAARPDSISVPSKQAKSLQVNLTCQRQSCSGNALLANFVKTFVEPKRDSLSEEFPNVERTSEGDLILEFSEEESDAAIEQFGCDCVESINALRMMRGMSIGVEGNPIDIGIKPCNQKAPTIDR